MPRRRVRRAGLRPFGTAHRRVQGERRARFRRLRQRAPPSRQRLVVAFQPEQQVASRAMRGNVPRALLHQAVVQFQGGLRLPLGLQQFGKVAQDADVVRRAFQRLAQQRLGLVQRVAARQQHGEVLQRLGGLLRGRDRHRPPQVALGLVEAFKLAERHGQVDERVVGIRPLRHGDARRRLRFLQAVLRDQRLGEVQMRPDGFRIALDDVLEERHLVAVDGRLPPRERGEQHQHRHAAARRGAAPCDGQRLRPDGGGADRHRQHADAGQILVAIRHERKQQVGVVDEAEGGRQRHHEEERTGERAAAKALAQEPQRRRQR